LHKKSKHIPLFLTRRLFDFTTSVLGQKAPFKNPVKALSLSNNPKLSNENSPGGKLKPAGGRFERSQKRLLISDLKELVK
jgi:hypothetical protein